ncbi:MAG: [LysW]-aminoadipate kinase [Bacillota bacterium]
MVKLGGSVGEQFSPVVDDVAGHLAAGEKLVLVHGGSTAADQLAERLGYPQRQISSPSGVSSRYTDRPSLEILLMACAGRLNKLLVEGLQQRGVNAVGLSGIDGGLLQASRKKAVRAVVDGRTLLVRDDYSGRLQSVNVGLLSTLLEAGYTPVLSSFALSEERECLNVDGDRVAALVAKALRAQALVFLTNVPGLLRDPSDPGSLVRNISARELVWYEKLALGRMKKKLLAAAEALAGGVGQVVIAGAMQPKPLGRALRGEGTVITP